MTAPLPSVAEYTCSECAFVSLIPGVHFDYCSHFLPPVVLAMEHKRQLDLTKQERRSCILDLIQGSMVEYAELLQTQLQKHTDPDARAWIGKDGLIHVRALEEDDTEYIVEVSTEVVENRSKRVKRSAYPCMRTKGCSGFVQAFAPSISSACGACDKCGERCHD
jgi:hypothetical protein